MPCQAPSVVHILCGVAARYVMVEGRDVCVASVVKLRVHMAAGESLTMSSVQNPDGFM